METPTKQLFDCIYIFETNAFHLVEIKRNDIGEYAPVSEKFQWLKISSTNGVISKLTFRSMDSSQEIEERYFEEGFLKFSKDTGTFIEKYNSAQHILVNKSDQELPVLLRQKICEFLAI